MTPTRPALRYHGGKWKLAPWIISYLPTHKIYVEPYGGAASVLLRKERSDAEVYNDLDGEIVNLFRVLRNPAQARELVRLAELTPFARAEFEESYIAHGDPIEQARRTLLRSFAGFGSAMAQSHATGFRDNTTRAGTTPAHDWANMPSALGLIVQRMRGVVVDMRPAIELIARHDTNETLFYLDPPYVAATRSERYRHSAYNFEMTDNEHRDMASALYAIHGMAIVSGYPCALYDQELFPDWKRIEKDTHADGARDRTEVLWISPRTWHALQDVSGLPMFAEVLS